MYSVYHKLRASGVRRWEFKSHPSDIRTTAAFARFEPLKSAARRLTPDARTYALARFERPDFVA